MRISSTFSSIRVAAALVFLVCSVCAAQSPSYSGVWKLNVEKSRWGQGTKPGNVVVVIDDRDGGMNYHGAVTYSSEDTRTFEFTGTFDGKQYRVSRSFGDGYIMLRRVDANTFDSVFHSDNGLYTETARTTLSRDGRTLTRKVTVRTPEGTQSCYEVYDRR